MRTAFLMTALTVLLVLVGDYFGGARGMMMMLIISLAMNLFSYWNSDKLVLAHELSHVKHGDILIGTIAASMAGIITTLSHWGMFFGGGDRDRNSSSAIVGLAMMILAPLAAGIIQMAVSRSREYMADKSGGELSGNPDALADALLKIESYAKNRTMPGATENTAHMFIICPFSAKDMQQLFSTHPSTADRVARLRAQAKAMRSSGGAK